MAHGFMQSFDSRLDVFSAGTEPASRVNPQAVEVMAEAGIDIGSHTLHQCLIARDLLANEEEGGLYPPLGQAVQQAGGGGAAWAVVKGQGDELFAAIVPGDLGTGFSRQFPWLCSIGLDCSRKDRKEKEHIAEPGKG